MLLIFRSAGPETIASCKHRKHLLLIQRQHMEHRQYADFKLEQSGSNESTVLMVGTGSIAIGATLRTTEIAARRRYHLKGRPETAEMARQSVISAYAGLKQPHKRAWRWRFPRARNEKKKSLFCSEGRRAKFFEINVGAVNIRSAGGSLLRLLVLEAL